MKEGKIIRIISNLYTVLVADEKIECQARGKFRKEKITPLVGDYCKIDIQNKYIMEILPRKNELKRPSIANVDVALIVTSLKKPDFSSLLLDKLISLVTMNNITPMLCFTKLDLLTKEELENYQSIMKYYKKIGYQVFTNRKLEILEEAIKGKMVVVTGQTGSGKSTLLNSLDPNLLLKTSPISEALNRGVHTTRHTEFFEIKGFYIADTPGFSALELKEFTKSDIAHSFIEFEKYPCKFRDCKHDKEIDCGVKKALEEGKILKSRYNSYLNLLSEVEQ